MKSNPTVRRPPDRDATDWIESLPPEKRGIVPPANGTEDPEEFAAAQLSVIVRPVRVGILGEGVESQADLAAGILGFLEDGADKSQGLMAKFLDANVIKGTMKRLVPDGKEPAPTHYVRFQLKNKEAVAKLWSIKRDLRYGYSMLQAYPSYAEARWKWQRDRGHLFRDHYKNKGFSNREMAARIILDEELLLPVFQVKKPGEKEFRTINAL